MYNSAMNLSSDGTTVNTAITRNTVITQWNGNTAIYHWPDLSINDPLQHTQWRAAINTLMKLQVQRTSLTNYITSSCGKSPLRVQILADFMIH